MTTRLSIVIPAYNEEGRIGPTLEEYLAHFRLSHPGEFEIIVSLNGCRDDTRGVVERTATDAPELRFTESAAPLGKGGAIMAGFAEAQGEDLLFVDADNMVRAPEAAKLLDALASRDIAIGDRYGAGDKRDSPLRRLISKASKLWARVFLGLTYPDMMCGAKAMRAEAWRAVAGGVEERGWAFDIDLLAQGRRAGCSVASVPVEWLHVEEGSKVRAWRDVPATFAATFGIRRRARRRAFNGGGGKRRD